MEWLTLRASVIGALAVVMIQIAYNAIFGSSRGKDLRRKIALATWNDSTNPNIFCKLHLDVSNLMQADFIRNKEVSINALLGVAFARTLANYPRLNGSFAFNCFWPNDTVDVCFLVSTPDGNLAPVLLKAADTLDAREVTRMLKSRAERVRSGKDENFKKNLSVARLLPIWLLRRVMWLVGLLSSGLKLDLPAIGVHRNAFGVAVISATGSLGIDEAYAPPTPLFRNPFLIIAGAVHEEAVVKDGKVAVGQGMNLNVTVDHRYIDGAEGSRAMKELKAYMEERFEELV